jgi:hypothetical protein
VLAHLADRLRSGSRDSSRSRSASGVSTRSRAAASSMANGRPRVGNRFQPRLESGHQPVCTGGRTLAPRSMNRRTNSYLLSCSVASTFREYGSASGGTATSRSPETRSSARLVTRSLSVGHAASRVASSFEVGDAAWAQRRTLGRRLLGQPGGDAVSAQRVTEDELLVCFRACHWCCRSGDSMIESRRRRTIAATRLRRCCVSSA